MLGADSTAFIYNAHSFTRQERGGAGAVAQGIVLKDVCSVVLHNGVMLSHLVWIELSERPSLR